MPSVSEVVVCPSKLTFQVLENIFSFKGVSVIGCKSEHIAATMFIPSWKDINALDADEAWAVLKFLIAKELRENPTCTSNLA
jgi:hypothetical protein